MIKQLGLFALLLAPPALADVVYQAPPRTMNFELKFGGYKPLIDSEQGLTGTPYADTFGGDMLLAELEVERMLWQKFGNLGVAASIGYAEKYGHVAVGSASETVSLHVLPVRVLGVYRFDWASLHYGVPLIPYGKLGFVYEPWWTQKSSGVEYAQTPDGSVRGAGGKWGYEFVAGLSFLLDWIEPRLAQDFNSDLGIVHSYIFGEFTFANVQNFSSNGLELSGRYWMFGLSLEY